MSSESNSNVADDSILTSSNGSSNATIDGVNRPRAPSYQGPRAPSFEGLRATSNVNNGVTVINNKWDNRRFTLTFTYRFGKTNGQQPRHRNSASEDEQNRVKSGGQQ